MSCHVDASRHRCFRVCHIVPLCHTSQQASILLAKLLNAIYFVPYAIYNAYPLYLPPRPS